MLLVSRLREESGGNIRVGVLRTVANTGAVITSAGLIFAASMFGLMVGSVAIMIQAGLIIGAGLLLDTFVVRTHRARDRHTPTRSQLVAPATHTTTTTPPFEPGGSTPMTRILATLALMIGAAITTAPAAGARTPCS